MQIGEAARHSGISAKMIRHYESIGLLPAANRSVAGYRHYGENDVSTLRFIRAARDLGFSLDSIRELLSLWQKRDRASREVKRLAEQHIATLEAKVHELNAMIAALDALACHCHGDDRPECPILEGLVASSGQQPARPGRKAPPAPRRPRAAD